MKSEKPETVEGEREEVKEQPKKPYTTPRLTKFGDVEELTGPMTGAGYDG